jgi:hypothetical protein
MITGAAAAEARALAPFTGAWENSLDKERIRWRRVFFSARDDSVRIRLPASLMIYDRLGDFQHACRAAGFPMRVTNGTC